jgi:hypothetical protein
MNASILSAQYNNTVTTPGQLSELRGSGLFETNYPLSSNWPRANFNPDTSNYVKGLFGPSHVSRLKPTAHEPMLVFPQYGSKWDLSNLAPVGKRVNDQWVFTKDQSSIPPGSKDSLEGDPYLQFGLQANHTTPTALNSLFFNKTNVQYLQKRIIDDVFQLTGVKIKPQSEDSLLVIMNNKYQYSLYGSLPTSSVVHLALPRTDNKPCSLKDRLIRLNQAVLQDCVKQIISGMNMYMTYYKDASSLPTPLSRPVNVSPKGGRVLQENIGLHSGNSRGIQSFNLRNSVIN